MVWRHDVTVRFSFFESTRLKFSSYSSQLFYKHEKGRNLREMYKLTTEKDNGAKPSARRRAARKEK